MIDTIGHSAYDTVTKKELIDMINKAYPDDTGYIAIITTIIDTDYSTKPKTKSYKQSVLFNKILGIRGNCNEVHEK